MLIFIKHEETHQHPQLKMAESLEIVYEGSFYKLPKLEKKKSFRFGRRPNKEKYFYLVRHGDKLHLEYYDKKPQSVQTEAKGRISLWPMYRVSKLQSDNKHICEITTTNQKIHIGSDNYHTINDFVYHLQTQTALKENLEGQSFLVQPVNSSSHAAIGSIDAICIIHISPWGVSLAIQSSRALLAQWPLKCIKTFETTGNGFFAILTGRRAPFGEGVYEFRTRQNQDNEMFGLMDHFISQEHSLSENHCSPQMIDVTAEITQEYDHLHRLTVINPRSSRYIQDTRNSGCYNHLFQTPVDFVQMRNIPDIVATSPQLDQSLRVLVQEKLENERKSLLNRSNAPPPALPPKRRTSGPITLPLPPRQSKSVADGSRLYEDLDQQFKGADDVFSSTPRLKNKQDKTYMRSKSNNELKFQRRLSNENSQISTDHRIPIPVEITYDEEESGYLQMDDIKKSRECLDILDNNTTRSSENRLTMPFRPVQNCESIEDILNESRSQFTLPELKQSPAPRRHRPPPLPQVSTVPESTYIDTSAYIETSIRSNPTTPTSQSASSGLSLTKSLSPRNSSNTTPSPITGSKFPTKPQKGRIVSQSCSALPLSRKSSLVDDHNYMRIDEGEVVTPIDKVIPMPFTGLMTPQRPTYEPRKSDGDDSPYTEMNEHLVTSKDSTVSVADFRSLDIKKARQKKQMLKSQSNPDMKNARKVTPPPPGEPATEHKKRESRLAALFTLRKKDKRYKSTDKVKERKPSKGSKLEKDGQVIISGVIITTKSASKTAYVKQKSPEQVMRRRAETSTGKATSKHIPSESRKTLDERILHSANVSGTTQRAQSLGDLL